MQGFEHECGVGDDDVNQGFRSEQVLGGVLKRVHRHGGEAFGKSNVVVDRQAVNEKPGVTRDEGGRRFEMSGLTFDQRPPRVVQLGGSGRTAVAERQHFTAEVVERFGKSVALK